MNIPETALKIIDENGCPLYRKGDVFIISGRAMVLPPGRPVCLVLADDIRSVAGAYDGTQTTHDAPPFFCSGPDTGCAGVIRLRGRTEDGEEDGREDRIREIIAILTQFPIFGGLSQIQLRELGRYLKFRKCAAGDVVIRKGEEGGNLYIIASGLVEVGDGALRIADLGKGEVFGEMSLISGDPITATVTVVESAHLLYIKGRDFRRILMRYPALQLYFARLLARRLATMNTLRLDDMTGGMNGSLSDLSAAELFQAMNVNQKTGCVTLYPPDGPARVCFRNGEPVLAEYRGMSGGGAFFVILGVRSGRFSFSSGLSAEEEHLPELGDFMWLLMEGARQMDEATS